MNTIKLILHIVSIIGYYMQIRKKQKIQKEFIPIIMFCNITIIIFIFGIINCMELGIMLIEIIGIVLFVKNIFSIKQQPKLDINFGIIFLVSTIIWSIYILKDVQLTHTDNFSHWALIVKEMLETNKLPSSNTIVTFLSYPPGAACFIWFICKNLGTDEWIMLFAQSLLVIFSMYTCFSLCKKEKYNYILYIILCVYILIGNIFINNLLVDTLLPVLGIASLVIVFKYKIENKKGLLCVTPLWITLILIKNSGIFFVTISILIWIFFYIKNTKNYKQILKNKYLIILILPFTFLFVWNTHVKVVFQEANTSKHAMSIANYSAVVADKNEITIKNIIKSIFKQILNIKKENNIVMLALFLTFVILLAYILKTKSNKQNMISLFILFLISFILYQIGLIFMYIYSMPVAEATVLASYSRYYKTIIMYEYGITFIATLNFINNNKIDNKTMRLILKIILVLFMATPLVVYNDKVPQLFVRSTKEFDGRSKLIELTNKYYIESNKNYLIYYSNAKMPLAYYCIMCKYQYLSNNVKVIKSLKNFEQSDNILNYNYLILLNRNEETNELLKSMGKDIELDVIKIK